MSELVVDRRHALGLKRATALAETMAKRLQGEFGGSYRWEGNTLHFTRTGATGRVAVTDNQLRVSVRLGLLLGALRGRIERELRAFLDEHLQPPAAPQRLRPPARRSASTKSSRSQGTSRSVRPK